VTVSDRTSQGLYQDLGGPATAAGPARLIEAVRSAVHSGYPGVPSPVSDFNHFDAGGRAAMVDVADKPATERTASARGLVRMRPETLTLIETGGAAKGDVLGVARIAGIMAAKRTADLIPLCHPLALTSVTLDLVCDAGSSAVVITATCKLTGRTGVEMEALTAVTVAALTVYDMCKAVDREIVLTDIRLVHKAGGRSGRFGEAP